MDSGFKEVKAMKKMYGTIGVILMLSVILTAVIIILSPDVIPAHYNAVGEVDRFGSKYENLIFPAIVFAVAAGSLLLLKWKKKNNATETEQKILLSTTIFLLLLFTAMGVFFGITAINYSNNPTELSTDTMNKFTSIGLGVLFIVLGNIMPKVRRNAVFGLRTKWSMENDSVWQKSQRFGGFSAVVCGLILIILAVVVPGIWNMVVLAVTVFVWSVACIVASYCYWKRDCNKQNDR